MNLILSKICRNFLLDIVFLTLRVDKVHKTLKTRVPLSLFQALSVDFPRITRSAANGQIRQDDSFLSQATFKYRAMKSYNSVPDSVRTGSTETVKRKLKQWTKTNIPID